MEETRKSAAVCPVCSVACDKPPLYTYTAEEAAAHFCPPTRDRDRYARLVTCIQWLWARNDCYVLQCPNCGFGFAEPYVAGNEEFYSILHEQHGYPSWRWDYDVAMDLAMSRYKGGRILDIGAGTGSFLSRVPAGWDKYAVEGSCTTRAILGNSRIGVFQSLEDAVGDGASFDVITMFQVLEHLAPFFQTLQQCRSLLRAGGKLVITVPDADAMKRQEQFTGCADMPPNHVNKWTPGSLSLALARAGFTAGAPIFQPPSLATLRSVVHLRILAQRTAAGSLAERTYRIRSKPVRVALLALLAGPAFVQMAPHIRKLWRGGAFAMAAS